MHLSIYLHAYSLPPTYHRLNIIESNNAQKRFAMILGEDDEKMLGLNINLTIGKHCNIISMNESLKS
jgi:hypothetical protein